MGDNEDDFINKNKRMKLINLIHNFAQTSFLLKGNDNKDKETIKTFLEKSENENIFDIILKKKMNDEDIKFELEMLYFIMNLFPILCNFFNDIIPTNQSIFQYFFDLVLKYDLKEKEIEKIKNILSICLKKIPLKKIDYFSFYQSVLKNLNKKKQIKFKELKNIFLIWGILYSIRDNYDPYFEMNSNLTLLYGINLSVKIPENYAEFIYNEKKFISGITFCIHLNLETFTKFERRVCQLINIRFKNQQNLTINLNNKLEVNIKVFNESKDYKCDFKGYKNIKFYFSVIFNNKEDEIKHIQNNNVFYLFIKIKSSKKDVNENFIIENNIKENDVKENEIKENDIYEEITDIIFLNDFIGKVYSIKGNFGCNEELKNFLMNNCKNNDNFNLINDKNYDDLINDISKCETNNLKFYFEPKSFKDDIGENQFIIDDNFDNLKLILNQGTFINKFMNYNTNIKHIGGFKEFLPLLDLIFLYNNNQKEDYFIIETIFNTLNNLLKFKCNFELFYEENMFEILGLYFQNFPSFLKSYGTIFENFINNIEIYYSKNKNSDLKLYEKFNKYFFYNLKFLTTTSIIKETSHIKPNKNIDYIFFLGDIIYFDLSINSQKKENEKEISKLYKYLLIIFRNIINIYMFQNKEEIKILIQNIFDLINGKISISNNLLNLLLDFLKDCNNQNFLNLLISNLCMEDKINELEDKNIKNFEEIKNKMIKEKICSVFDILFKSKDCNIVYKGFEIIFNLLLYIDDEDNKNFFYEYINNNIFNQTNLEENDFLNLMNYILLFLKNKLKNFNDYRKYGLNFLVILIFKIYQKSKDEYVIKSFLLNFISKILKTGNFVENFFNIVNQDNFVQNPNFNLEEFKCLYEKYNILQENDSLLLFYFINEYRKYLPKDEELKGDIFQFLLNQVHFIIKGLKEHYNRDLLISKKINELYFKENKLLKKSGFKIFFEFYFDNIILTQNKNNLLYEFKDIFDFLIEQINSYEKINTIKMAEKNKRQKIKDNLKIITNEFLINLKNKTDEPNTLNIINSLFEGLKNFEDKTIENNNNNQNDSDNNNSQNPKDNENEKSENNLLEKKLKEERNLYENYKNNCYYIYLVDLKKRIEMYKKTKLKLFRLNEFWVAQNILKNNNNEKFQFRNHFTSNLIRPLLKPVLIENIFNTKENTFDDNNDEFSLINLNLFQKIFKDEKINEIINKMIDFENLDKYKNIFRCCLIKEQRHINGFLTITDENIIKFIPLRELKILSCFGSEFYNKCSFLFDVENYYDLIKIKTILISDIILVFLRNYFFKDSAIEIITKNGKGYYFNFFDKKKEFLTRIININENMIPILLKKVSNEVGYYNLFYLQNNIVFNTQKEIDIINLWNENKISNSYFLMLINYFSNRSFFDITQYPIFPLLYSNDDKTRDLSNSVRQEIINNINNDETNNSYYSNYEGVKNCLVKIYPFLLYRTKKFDMRKTWSVIIDYNNNNNNNNNNKESMVELTISKIYEFIPEYFYLPDLLLLNNKFFYGNNNIVKKFEFVINNSELIESKEVSTNLDNWINLIFGIYQKNEKKNNNISFDLNIDISILTNNQIEEKVEKGLFPLKIFGDEKIKKKTNFKPKNILFLKKKIKKNIIKLKKVNNLPFFLMKYDNLFQQFFILINEKYILIYKHETGFFDSVMIKYIAYYNNNIERFNFTKMSEDNYPNYFITQNHIAISKNNHYIFLGGQFNGNISFFNFYLNLAPMKINIEDKCIFTALELVEVYNNFLLCGNHLGNLYVYEINENYLKLNDLNFYNKKENINKLFGEEYKKKEDTKDILIFKNIIYLCFDEINHINYNEELNLFTVASKDGYVHLLTFPQLKIVQTIYLETPVNYAFVVNKPFPLIIVYCNEKKILKSFSINGTFIQSLENINCNSPKIYGDNYNKGGIIFQDSRNTIKCLKFPDFSKLFKDSDTYTFDSDISCIELSKDCSSIFGIDINSQKIEYIYKN